MEFNEKIQELRKKRGLTQEELAEALYVSRTAVSKWESGRGYPNIESLKAISAFFSVTIDALLSSDEVLNIAEEDHRQTERRMHDLVFGVLDCSAILLFFLPFFGQRTSGTAQGVSLLSLGGIDPYLKAVYIVVILAMMVSGILMLVLRNSDRAFWERNKNKVSFLPNAAGIFLFIASPQPYAAALLFMFLGMKLLMRAKKA